MVELNRVTAFESLSSAAVRKYLMITYVLVLCATHSGVTDGVRVWGALFCLAGLFLPWLLSRSAFWFALAFTLSLNLIYNYADAANHFYLTIYATLFFALEAYRREHGYEGTTINVPRALIVIAFLFATLQKIITPYFASGRLLADYFLNGNSLYKTLSLVFADHPEAVEHFVNAYHDVAASPALGETSVALIQPGDGFVELARGLALSIVVVEFLVFASFAIGRVFRHELMPLVVLGFVWGTYYFRPEFGFYALLCILFFLSRPDLKTHWKVLIVASAAAFLAFDVGDIEVLT